MQNYQIKQMKKDGDSIHDVRTKVNQWHDNRMKSLERLADGEGESIQEVYGEGESRSTVINHLNLRYDQLMDYADRLYNEDTDETRKICIWPNRDWCAWEELESYGRNKSDDYHTVDVSLDIDDEKLDQLISEGVYDLNDSGVLKALVQAWSQDPIMHTPTKCTHDPTANIHCPICDGGLFVCSVCGAAEGELTSECPQTKMTDDQRTAVFEGRLDYRAGQWVEKPSMNPN